MINIENLKKISLKNHPEINEAKIQEYIYEHPNILGLGDLESKQREKIQPTGGRIDMLLNDNNNELRYEVEIQLGATDPSHIIRTIEYWDTERKRYPQYDHCAVIIAEEITGRFMNVISLFNGNIPLVAIQMSAYQLEKDKILLTFTKVMDRIILEDEIEPEQTNREYWEKRTNVLNYVDEIFSWLPESDGKREPKYNKYYIGIKEDGMANNFLAFHPKKNFMYLDIRMSEDQSMMEKMEQAGLEVEYLPSRAYRLRISDMGIIRNNQELIKEAIKTAAGF